MIDLTIDTCVLVDASRKGVLEHFESSLCLLTEFTRDSRLHAVIDQIGFVSHEYRENINATMFAAAWLKQFAPRTKTVPIGPLPKGLRTKLDELHFNIKDRRFIQVALASNAKIIVTRDPDYSSQVITELNRHYDIKVFNAEQTLAFVRI